MITDTIRKFVGRLFGPALTRGPQRIPSERHGIDRRNVSRHAIKVCEVLRQHGYEAYVVGGAVRDLILGLEPKDFDVATNATPEQIRPLFRRARIIGRRFQLVHVVFGQEIIETSTFRAPASADQENRRTRPHPARQRIRLAGRRRGAARLHHERALLRSPHRGSHRLPQRRSGSEETPDPHDRRSGQALPRRSRADAARRALCGQAQRQPGSGYAPAHQHHGQPDRERARLAAVR